MDFIAGLFVLMILYYVFWGAVILIGAYIVLRIIVAIICAIRDANSGSSVSSNTKYTPSATTDYSSDTTSVRKDSYNIDMDYAIPPKRADSPKTTYTYSPSQTVNVDYIDDDIIDEVMDNDSIDTALDYDKREEEERLYEPYVCPECGDPYDGIMCETCGFAPELGYEEISNDERFVEDMTAMFLFDAEEKRMKAEKEEKLFGRFGDDYYDEDDW